MSSLQNFLDCTNRPFDFHPDGRIPDGFPNNTVPLVDFLEDNGLVSPIYTAEQVVVGFGMYYTYGQNQVRDSTYSVAANSRQGALYGVSYFLISQSGAILNAEFGALPPVIQKTLIPILDRIKPSIVINKKNHTRVIDENEMDETSDTKEDARTNVGAVTQPFFSYDMENIGEITGSSDGYNDTTALAVNMRLLSAGIRFWPVIELVTDSSTLAVSRYYAFQICPEALAKCAVNGDDMYTVARDCPQFSEYVNREGCSSRTNVIQDHPFKLYEMVSLETMNNDYLTTNAHFFPCLICRLTASQTIAANASFTFPVRTDCRMYAEAVLIQPTPLISSKVILQQGWLEACRVFAYKTDIFPTVCSGHSFMQIGFEFIKDLAMATQHPALLTLAGVGGTIKAIYDVQKRRGYQQKPPAGVNKNIYKVVKKPKSNKNKKSKKTMRSTPVTKGQIMATAMYPSSPRRGRRRSRSQRPRSWANPRNLNSGMSNFDNYNLSRNNNYRADLQIPALPTYNAFPVDQWWNPDPRISQQARRF